MKRLINQGLGIFLALYSPSTCSSFDIGGTLDAVSGGINLNSIASGAGLDLSSLGLDGLNVGDVMNLDFGSLSSSLSIKCDYPISIPKIPTNFCASSLATGSFSFGTTLNLGKCQISAGANASGAELSFGEMAMNYCLKMNNQLKSVSPIENSILRLKEQRMYNILTPSINVSVFSKYGHETTVNIPNIEYGNGLTYSNIYSPDGLLGFDRMYQNDKDIPKALIDAYNSDDYSTYRAYEKYVTSAKSTVKTREGWSNNDKNFIDFSDFSNIKTGSFLEYKAGEILQEKKIIDSYSTPYIIKNKLEEEVARLKELYGNINSSNSAQMKASYMQNKGKILDALLDISPVSAEDKNKSGFRELRKAMDDLEEFERLKFAEREEEYKRTHNYIVNPSNYKILTKSTEYQIKYADKISWQQTQEARRIAENERQITIKEERLKLLAQQIFLSSLEYNPSIAQKEIDEILGQ